MVLDKYKDHSKLTPGVVMVVHDTDPNWMPAFEYLAIHGGAIITEIGGRLCHAAIVSRELKIPCVVGLVQACLLLYDKTVEVDGKLGTVTIQ
jgi:pyruvate,water dikinase